MQNSLLNLATSLGQALKNYGLLLTTAESCTGGQIAQTITDIAGSSQWFERGFVTYSNAAKQEMLGVQAITLERYGAVSAEIAMEMAEGALCHSHAQLSLAITGIAGPDGGTAEKPVGMVCFAWAGIGWLTQTEVQIFTGDRLSIRTQATEHGLKKLLEFMNRHL